jgi:GTP-binding protein
VADGAIVGSETFVDEATITVSSGAGGPGRVGFRREKFVPRGGPDGGDGGHGGQVVLVADRNENTLLSFRSRREFRAKNGDAGGTQQATGADGASVEIRVPVGTMVFSADPDEESTGERATADADATPLVDLAEDGQRWTAARGGRGGRGNARFKTATRQTPDYAQGGLPGELQVLRLSLKLLADVGLVGFPNAGKSTLIRAISAAKPRVASYPFTTLVPSLGVVELDDRRIVVADIPGLIEGASDGAGLGDRFLRHVERTRVLVHVLDLGAMLLEGRNLLEDYDKLRKELGRYRPELLERREIVLLNKTDLVPPDQAGEVNGIAAALVAGGSIVLRGSGATGEGTRELVVALIRTLDEEDSKEERTEGAS